MKARTRREFLKAMGVGAGAVAAAPLARAAGEKKPNVILVFTDDQGWTDTSVRMMKDRPDSRSDFYRTPALERLAREGMVFSNAYAPSPVCTPSRASVQFGKTTARLRQTTVHDVLAKSRGIDCKNEVSIAQMVKSADPSYATAHFGKWGFPPRSPEHAGYDVTDGATNNFHGDWRSTKDRRPLPEDDPKQIFGLARRANVFIEKQVKRGRPFFMQISHYALHVQHYALKATVEKYRGLPLGEKCRPGDYRTPPPPRNGWILLYAAMIENLDTSLGMLLDKVDKLGIRESTYVIFTSDNGGGFRGNAPLRGGKANLWEGGLRVPMVVRGPGVKAGCQCDVPVAGWDFLPTISDLVGNGDALPDGIDGGSLRPLFEKGNAGAVRRGTEALVFHFPWYANLPMSAIRLGDYKLMKNLNTGELRLFNLAEDIGESTDLSRSMPGKTKELHGLLTEYLKAVDAETVEDMRAARRKELLGYLANSRRKVAELEDQLAEASGAQEKGRLEKGLADARRSVKRHTSAIDQMERARRMTAW